MEDFGNLLKREIISFFFLTTMPVVHILKFDLEEHKNTWFWKEVFFFKTSNEACHAQFSRDN